MLKQFRDEAGPVLYKPAGFSWAAHLKWVLGSPKQPI